ncbi:MAG: 5'-nucleotidase C-terminal domain-containing protein [Flavobacteriaceae bacterium]|nr:5'-nucleotidase C-terminal domain-containing protein [Mangrovimonas sp.]MCB0470207.1 5'-nucleotidase C-terminal domain-containing protein [Flavobacteriaceae bacterium]HPF96820.1 5'-nucleotidase C-terminal domain-containing protein [Mangrovimonas sp.]
MKPKHIFSVFLITLLLNCQKEKPHLSRIEGTKIEITDSLETNKAIDSFIKPFRDHLNKDLDSVISYSVDTYTKNDGELNTALGNLLADLVYEEANPIFNSRTGKNIDMVLLNHGGIRSILSKGNITKRTAFEIMPFENSLVVAEVKGRNILGAVDYLRRAKRAHPISRLQIILDKDYNLEEASINGQPIDSTKTYYIATNDYLFNGGDHMDFFKPYDSLYVLNYKVRNAILDYFIKKDTIAPKADNRFIVKEK